VLVEEYGTTIGDCRVQEIGDSRLQDPPYEGFNQVRDTAWGNEELQLHHLLTGSDGEGFARLGTLPIGDPARTKLSGPTS